MASDECKALVQELNTPTVTLKNGDSLDVLLEFLDENRNFITDIKSGAGYSKFTKLWTKNCYKRYDKKWKSAINDINLDPIGLSNNDVNILRNKIYFSTPSGFNESFEKTNDKWFTFWTDSLYFGHSNYSNTLKGTDMGIKKFDELDLELDVTRIEHRDLFETWYETIFRYRYNVRVYS